MFKNRIAQSTLEYAVIIAVIVGALIAMQIYIKRGVQGRFREASDQIGEQFAPDATNYEYTTISNTVQTEKTNLGATNVTINRGEQYRTGTENVGALPSAAAPTTTVVDTEGQAIQDLKAQRAVLKEQAERGEGY